MLLLDVWSVGCIFLLKKESQLCGKIINNSNNYNSEKYCKLIQITSLFIMTKD